MGFRSCFPSMATSTSSASRHLEDDARVVCLGHGHLHSRHGHARVPIKPLRIVGDLYVQIFRNIPGVSLLIIVAYALPNLNIVLPWKTCVMVAVVLLPRPSAPRTS